MTAKTLDTIASDESELEMTSMIDVTFLLLIFFMCTLRFKTLEGKLSAHLPGDVGPSTIESEPIERIEVRVSVLESGAKLHPDGRPYSDPSGQARFIFDDTRQLEYRIGTRRSTSLAETGRRLGELRGQRQALGQLEVPATIDAGPGTVYADVVQLLDTAIAAGFADITFVGAAD